MWNQNLEVLVINNAVNHGRTGWLTNTDENESTVIIFNVGDLVIFCKDETKITVTDILRENLEV